MSFNIAFLRGLEYVLRKIAGLKAEDLSLIKEAVEEAVKTWVAKEKWMVEQKRARSPILFVYFWSPGVARGLGRGRRGNQPATGRWRRGGSIGATSKRHKPAGSWNPTDTRQFFLCVLNY